MPFVTIGNACDLDLDFYFPRFRKHPNHQATKRASNETKNPAREDTVALFLPSDEYLALGSTHSECSVAYAAHPPLSPGGGPGEQGRWRRGKENVCPPGDSGQEDVPGSSPLGPRSHGCVLSYIF